MQDAIDNLQPLCSLCATHKFSAIFSWVHLLNAKTKEICLSMKKNVLPLKERPLHAPDTWQKSQKDLLKLSKEIWQCYVKHAVISHKYWLMLKLCNP